MGVRWASTTSDTRLSWTLGSLRGNSEGMESADPAPGSPPTEIKTAATLVEAVAEDFSDAGSIPATSTNNEKRTLRFRRVRFFCVLRFKYTIL